MDAAKTLTAARRRAGLSQRELAERTGVAQPTIARIERGQADPRVSTMTTLLAACGWRVEPIPRRGHGVDRTLIRDMLRRTPAERLHVIQETGRGFGEFFAKVDEARGRKRSA